MKNEDYPFYDVYEGENIKELILTNEEEFAESTAIKYMKRRRVIDVTYSQLKEQIDFLGTYFYMRGIRNIKAAILGNNCYEWVLSFLTLVCGDNIAVPIDKNLKSSEVLEIIKETQCSVIFYDSVYIDIVKEIRDKCNELNIFIKFNDINIYIEEGKALLESGRRDFVFENVKGEWTAAIFYTCSVASKSKGIELSHKNIMSAALSESKITFLGDITMSTIPFHHAFSIISALIAPFIQRCVTIIDPNEKKVMEDLKILQPDSITIVPSTISKMYNELYKKVKEVKNLKRKVDFILFLLSRGIDMRKKLYKYTEEMFGGCLRYIICKDCFLDEKYINFFRAFGIEVLNGYGLTECSSIISINRNEFNRPGSVGQVVPDCDFRISEEGEILIRGSMVMKGYYKDEELTKKCFKKGWFKTNDIGYMDSDGFLYIVGRMKNVIMLSSGDEVSTLEVEERIMKSSSIKEVAVYEEKGKIVADVFPDYSLLKKKGVYNIESYIRNEVKNSNKNFAKYKRIDKIVLKKGPLEKPPLSKASRYRMLNMHG